MNVETNISKKEMFVEPTAEVIIFQRTDVITNSVILPEDEF